MDFFYSQKKRDPQEHKSFFVQANEKTQEQEIEQLSLILAEIIRSSSCKDEDIVFLCIGSDRYVGDSLGPLAGTMLKESQVPYRIYGTLEEPVHSFNLKKVLKGIQKQFKKTLIISIDACLGEKNQVGQVIFQEGPLVPGKALEKVLPAIGDYHMKGMVNYIDPLPTSQFLNDTRLYTVMNLAKIIVKIITRAADKSASIHDTI
ncbi:spore protease YyaC [Bacillus sp. OTU530]|uniref:spore protease YyaC n=1 Tax=Bacillus sp. OTU530 TaxID=3043862 RepID=UPI00313B9CE1